MPNRSQPTAGSQFYIGRTPVAIAAAGLYNNGSGSSGEKLSLGWDFGDLAENLDFKGSNAIVERTPINRKAKRRSDAKLFGGVITGSGWVDDIPSDLSEASENAVAFYCNDGEGRYYREVALNSDPDAGHFTMGDFVKYDLDAVYDQRPNVLPAHINGSTFSFNGNGAGNHIEALGSALLLPGTEDGNQLRSIVSVQLLRYKNIVADIDLEPRISASPNNAVWNKLGATQTDAIRIPSQQNNGDLRIDDPPVFLYKTNWSAPNGVRRLRWFLSFESTAGEWELALKVSICYMFGDHNPPL